MNLAAPNRIDLNPRRTRAFTLLEVMFAMVAFATATIAILALVSQTLENARRLQRPPEYPRMLILQDDMTNQLVEGTTTGNLADSGDDSLKEYTYERVVAEVNTNFLFSVGYKVFKGGNPQPVSVITNFYYKPQSPAGSMEGATVAP